MRRRPRAESGSSMVLAAIVARGVAPLGGVMVARWGPAGCVVGRVVETALGRRWIVLSRVCTFAGSSSRNLRSGHPVAETGGAT